MNIRFNRKDLLYIILCILVVTGAIWYQIQKGDEVFPEHVIDFQVDRGESAGIGAEFFRQMGKSLQDYQHAVAFDYDEAAKVFLEKEVGSQGIEELLEKELCLWHWANRWFKPLSREEYRIDVTPRGDVTYFQHTIPEEAESPSLSIDEARSLSQKYLQQVLAISIADWEFIEQKTEVKPNRVDYLFTYKKKDVEIFNSTYRFEIRVQGDQIGMFRKYLKVPEEWLRDYKHLRSLNDTTATIADALALLLLIAAIATLIVYVSRKNIRMKLAVTLGVITFVLNLLSDLNGLPISLFYFDTNQSLASFYTMFVLFSLLKSALLGFLVILITAAGELLYRRHYPNKISLRRTFSRKGLQTKESFYSLVIGVTLAWVFIAFQTFFYLTAKRFGAWAPSEVSYSDSLNTVIPWIFVLFGGFTPAVLEEFTFRMFSIPLFEKLLKSRVIAILIPALIWGFAHANYPNQPFWIRGFEVGLFGVIVGIVFLRSNILTLLVWHYTVDAIMSAGILVNTGKPYLVISGCIAAGLMAVPLLFNLISYYRHRGFRSPAGLLNADECTEPVISPVRKEKVAPPETGYIPLAAKTIKSGFLLMLVFLLILLIPVRRIGEFYRFPARRAEIIETAKNFLINEGVDPDQYSMAAALESDFEPQWGKYILEHTSINNLNKILAQHVVDAIAWDVRFYQALEKEEYRIYVNPQSREVVGFQHAMEDSAFGYSIDLVSAQHRVEEFITQQGFNLASFELVETFSQKMKNRTDHTFIWESKAGHPANIGDGRLRFRVVVNGDEIALFDRFYKLPEEWSQLETQSTTWDSVRLIAQIGVMLTLVIVFVIVMFRKFRNIDLKWKSAFLIGGILVLMAVVGDLLHFNQLQMQYNTSWSPGVFHVFSIVIVFLKNVGLMILVSLLLMILLSFFPNSLPSLRSGRRYIYTKDALFSSLLLVLGLFAMRKIGFFLAAQYPAGIINPELWLPDFISSSQPLVSSFINILLRTVLGLGVGGVLILLVKHVLSKTALQTALVLLLLALFQPQRVDTALEFFVNYTSIVLIVFWVWLAFSVFLRDNPPGYLYSALGYFSGQSIIALVLSGSPFGMLDANFLSILLAALVIWLLTEKKFSRFSGEQLLNRPRL